MDDTVTGRPGQLWVGGGWGRDNVFKTTHVGPIVRSFAAQEAIIPGGDDPRESRRRMITKPRPPETTN